MRNGWRATGRNKTATGRRKALKCVHFIGLQQARQQLPEQLQDKMLKTQLQQKRSSSIASSWHTSAFSFCSSPSKSQDNFFFRSTQPMKVWKCLDGHVCQLLFASSASVRSDLSSKGRLYENLLLSASRLPFHLAQVLYSSAEGLNILPLVFL